MNSVSALKNTKNAVFALITNGVGGNFSIFTVLASIVVNASILPPIYYFYKLIKARQEGSKDTNYEEYDDVGELVAASPNIRDENGRPIIDPRKEKGVMAGKASIYRLTCVIGSIISLALSILSLYSFISSLRFKNQMNAWGISFALLSPLVAAVTIFLQGQLVSKDGAELIEVIAEEIGINRLHSTTRDVDHYAKSEPMVEVKAGTIPAATAPDSGVGAEIITIEKPYYYSFVCALSLSFAAFAQSIAVYKLPNTMRISAFVVCANLCFALSKLIFDAYYAYQCNIYDRQNIVVVFGDKIQKPGAESSDERSLLRIRLSGTLSELRGALNTKLDETIELIKNSIMGRSQLVVKATLLKLALNSLENPDSLAFLRLAESIADTANIAMHIMHKKALQVGDIESAIYSTGFNGRNPALLKADRADLTEPLEEEACIHRFKDGKVKMENQHLCYDREEAASLLNGEIKLCKVHKSIGPKLTQKATVTSLELVALVLAANHLDTLSFVDDDDGPKEILKTIQEVMTKAEGAGAKGAMVSLDNLEIAPERLLQQLKDVERAFDLEVKQMATAGA